MSSLSKRSGFFAGGNFIIDSVKTIDGWPEQDTLCSISEIERCNGGGPYNLLKNLARLDPALKLEACGQVGDDPEGQSILDDCQACGIGTTQLRKIAGPPTSVTDVMTDAATGRRTFFHARGANADLDQAAFDFSASPARVFYLGYLMLLDTLDELDEAGSTGASRVLRSAREAGMIAAVDCVSTPHPQWREIALASLREADVFFFNDLEAGMILGREVMVDNAEAALGEIGEHASHGSIVLHFPDGAYVRDAATGEVVHGPSLDFPNAKIAGASGAGDAFATGYLYGVHEGWTVAECLRAAACVAAASLSAATPSDGILPIADCLQLSDQYGFRQD